MLQAAQVLKQRQVGGFPAIKILRGVESALSTGAAPSTNLPTGGTDCDRQAPAREHAQPPQLHLRQLRSHLQLLHRCQRHVDDDGSWPRWAHNPERKASFLEPDQNRGRLCRVMWQECSN